MQLTDVEVRILGSLVEKETTTPDAYPLSLNALVNACNQTSNRDPVMALEEDTVRWAINNLRQQSLVRAIQRSDSRVMKYQHLMSETMGLDGAPLAVMCVLMLRGAQTPGEIRGRTGRLHEFGSVADVDVALSDLMTRGLVVELPRRAGQKEVRYAHLLSGAVSAVAVSEEPGERGGARAKSGGGEERIVALEATVEELQRELAELRARFEEFQKNDSHARYHS